MNALRATVLLAVLTASAAAQKPADVVEVSVWRTPGMSFGMFREGEPAEAILVRRNGPDDASIIVRINVPRTLIVQYTEREIHVPIHVLTHAAELALEQKLIEWEPQGQKTADEYGQTGYEVNVLGTAHRKTWGGKVKNDAAPLKLARYLVQLVNDRMDVPIEFIGKD